MNKKLQNSGIYKIIRKIDINTNQIIKIWNSIKEARQNFNDYSNSINSALRGRYKTARNFRWEYI